MNNIKPTTQRDYLFDNLKAILLILVIFGHAIEFVIYRSDGIIKYIYTAIYVFHMPVFLFISGYFSKRHNTKRILSLLLTYILWQELLYPLCLSLITNKSFEDIYRPIYYPQASYWYILALIIWRALIPYLNKIKHIVPISILVSLAFGFLKLDFDLKYFTLGRLFVFFPFFLLGYKCSKETILKWRKDKRKILNTLIFIAIISVTTILIHSIKKYGVNVERPNRILMPHYYYYECYENIGISFAMKVVLLIVQLISIPLMIKIVSNKPSFLSNIGRYSIFIYLFHMVLVNGVKINYLNDLTFKDANIFMIVCFIASLLYCFILSRKPIAEKLEKFTNIKID